MIVRKYLLRNLDCTILARVSKKFEVRLMIKTLKFLQLDNSHLPPNMAAELHPRIYSSSCPLIYTI